jgi:hypothetical protein
MNIEDFSVKFYQRLGTAAFLLLMLLFNDDVDETGYILGGSLGVFFGIAAYFEYRKCKKEADL